MEFSRLGRVFVSFLVLFVSIQSIAISSYLLLITMIIAGMIVFICLFVIYGSLSFFTTESLEFMNILTDGAREFGKVPFSFYGTNILKFLTYIVPLACVQYYPLMVLIGMDVPVFYAYYPLFSLLFIIPTSFIWKIGLSHYKSTGS